jgi:hypothetical protein
LVERDDKYVQLKKKDIEGNHLRVVHVEEVLGAAYISETCFKKLKKDPGSGTFDFGSGVPIRTREGSPVLAEAVMAITRRRSPGDATSGLGWSNIFDNGVKAESVFVSLRFVNPNIDFILRPLSKMVSVIELQAIIDANKDLTKQRVMVSVANPDSRFIMVCGLPINIDIAQISHFHTNTLNS